MRTVSTGIPNPGLFAETHRGGARPPGAAGATRPPNPCPDGGVGHGDKHDPLRLLSPRRGDGLDCTVSHVMR